jgi:hypothetical protein
VGALTTLIHDYFCADEQMGFIFVSDLNSLTVVGGFNSSAAAGRTVDGLQRLHFHFGVENATACTCS